MAGEGPLAAVQFEPVVANESGGTCTTDDAGVANDVALPSNLGQLDLLFANTDANGSAEAGAADVILTVPNLPVIRAEVLSAQAATDCSSGSPVLTSRSRVVGLTIGGQEIVVPPGHTDIIPGGIPIPPPLGPVTLHLNETITGPNMVTQRALWLDTGILDVIVAEAIADFEGNPCGPVCPDPPIPFHPCPPEEDPHGTATRTAGTLIR